MQGDSPTFARAGRTVTILFTEVAGSTERPPRLSEAAAARLRERHFTLVPGERNTDIDAVLQCVWRVAAGGVEIDPELVAGL
jgi:hypothetical protein